MIAVDTNVLVRFYLNDDRVQAARAARLLAEEDVFVPKTVLLELEWVLRGVARVAPAGIVRSLKHLIGLPNVRVEDERNVKAALEAFARGMDFADALHVASSRDADRFASFDTSLAKRAPRSFSRPAIVAPSLDP